MKAASIIGASLYLCSCALLADDAAMHALTIVRSDGVSVHFSVELAVTSASRSRGLMGRAELPPRQGMWFDFEGTTEVSMWMKDTPLPLDMLFVDADGTIVSVHTAAIPFSYALIAAPRPVRYVLELNAGEARGYALAAGDRVVWRGP